MQDIGASATLYPFAYDVARDRLMLVPMDVGSYRAASFLDLRLGLSGRWFTASSIEAAMAKGHAARPLHFIFHAGHVGSTLLSRLLDEAAGVLSLREPMPLRALAEMRDADNPLFQTRLETMLKLWERGFPDTRAVILKATSSTARIAEELFAARSASKAVLLNVGAETYLATMLAGENSAADLNALGPERWGRLQRLLGHGIPRPENLGELIAMSWAAETLTQRKAAASLGARLLPIDFDRMLGDIGNTLERVLKHFDLSGDGAAIAASGSLNRYSKAPEHAYSPSLRSQLLVQAQKAFEREIVDALEWLSRIGMD